MPQRPFRLLWDITETLPADRSARLTADVGVSLGDTRTFRGKLGLLAMEMCRPSGRAGRAARGVDGFARELRLRSAAVSYWIGLRPAR